MHPNWKRKDPAPDTGVVRALEQALEAARRGHMRSCVLITVNPLHEPEIAATGDLSTVGRVVLIGALSVAAKQLLDIPL